MNILISPKEYVSLINKKIQEMDGYLPGMEVYLFPDEKYPSGYRLDDRFGDVIKILVDKAEKELSKDYDVKFKDF